ALVLSGQKESAAEYLDEWERRVNAWDKERALLGRDIGDICAEFHAKEAETAKALKLGDMWEPAPFDVELPDSERGPGQPILSSSLNHGSPGRRGSWRKLRRVSAKCGLPRKVFTATVRSFCSFRLLVSKPKRGTETINVT